VTVLGVTTVAGNQTLDRVTHNARMVATVGGLEHVPIVAGSARPLVRELRTAPEIHGESGLDGPAPIDPTVELTAGHGAQFLAETVLAEPGAVTVVPTGPLTNLALALRMYPEIADAVERVVLMGGSYTRGNTTPAAEFNIYVDPEAADAVFSAGWDLTMIGLDVTHLALYTPQVGERLAAIDTRAARWMAQLLTFFGESYRTSGRMGAPPIHDAGAVASVIDPSLVRTREARVEIETAGRLTRGMTVVDFNASADTRAHHVGVDLDVERFWDLVLAAVSALS
jgi:purine nucleosidase